MLILAYTIHIIVSLFLILVVLLQQGQGADLSVFGGGATQAAFGARGAANILHKLTVVAFVLFIVTTMGIGFLQQRETSASVMTDFVEEAAPVATETEVALPAAEAEQPAVEGDLPTADEADAAAGDDAGAVGSGTDKDGS